jgi:hypothetical protein
LSVVTRFVVPFVALAGAASDLAFGTGPGFGFVKVATSLAGTTQ